MHAPDETNLHILELLTKDACRPFSDTFAEVDFSAPAVSDRIDRLHEEDITCRFAVDLNQSTLSGRTLVLIRPSVRPEFVGEVHGALRAADPVQRLFIAADGEVIAHTRFDRGSVRAQLDGLVGLSRIRDYEASFTESMGWSPTVNGTDFTLECIGCGDTVTNEGESARIGGPLYHFCCLPYLGRFEDRYGRSETGANND